MQNYHTIYTGRCLCGETCFEINAEPIEPHLCSCNMCRLWAGSATVPWISFPVEKFKLTGKHKQLNYYHSSEKTQRGRCKVCGSPICAVNDGDPLIGLVLTTIDEPMLSQIVPHHWHNEASHVPLWWDLSLNQSSE
ncbi:MAG: hypothetical protein CENE_01157 [Candidatus Celerinatantimonas neptuna]|nr:MAG: hypothetical protein CENE_01157 [Candidatus Celerinatantimonas neptuna]